MASRHETQHRQADGAAAGADICKGNLLPAPQPFHCRLHQDFRIRTRNEGGRSYLEGEPHKLLLPQQIGHWHMVYALLDKLFISCQFRCFQRLVKVDVEINPFLLQHMGKQYLGIQAGRFHALGAEVLLSPLQDAAYGPYIAIFTHALTSPASIFPPGQP